MKFVGDSERKFFFFFLGGGHFWGEKTWGVLQQKLCGTFRTKILEGLLVEKTWGLLQHQIWGEFYSIKFVGDLEPNLGRLLKRKIGEFHSIKFCGRFRIKVLGGLLGEKHWGVLPCRARMLKIFGSGAWGGGKVRLFFPPPRYF